MKISAQHALVCALLVTVGGCAALDDYKYETTQKHRAKVAYAKHNKSDCETYPKDYKLGWLDGFYSISTGGPDCPPAIAPKRYWNTKQILKDCDNRRHAFYSGWQDGAACASQFPDTHFLRLFETCECTVPRCETGCNDGGYDDGLGHPIHNELIETPDLLPLVPPVEFPAEQEGGQEENDDKNQAEELETPEASAEEELVPPAPVKAKNSKEDKNNSDDVAEDDVAKGDDEKSDDKTVANVIETHQDQVTQPAQFVDLAAETLNTAPTEQSLRESDAHSILGSAFDLLPQDTATVQLQQVDPAKQFSSHSAAESAEQAAEDHEPTSSRRAVEATEVVEAESSAVDTHSLVKQATPILIDSAEPTIVLPAPPAELLTSDIPATTSAPTVDSVQPADISIVRPAAKYRIHSQPVGHRIEKPAAAPKPPVKKAVTTKDQPPSLIQEASPLDISAKAVANPEIRQVHFEMIESDQLEK